MGLHRIPLSRWRERAGVRVGNLRRLSSTLTPAPLRGTTLSRQRERGKDAL
jgi:hypothetical protein